MTKITCYFDGSCGPENPGGKMGIGVVVDTEGEKHKYSESFPASESNSNNVAEYSALSYILYYLESQEIFKADITIIGDSMLVINQMSGKWKIKGGMYASLARDCKNKLEELLLKNPFLKVEFKWVAREENYYADSLSR